MVTYVRMPKLSWTMTEGIVRKWHKNLGDAVEKGEPICEIETEKALDELEAPESGILRKIVVPEGSIAEVNQIISIIAEADEPLPEELPSEEISHGPETVGVEVTEVEETEAVVVQKERVRVSPVARKLAQEHGISLEKIKGTGPDGRIVKEDVLEAIEKTEKEKVTPLTQMRKVIKDRLSYSLKTALHVPLTIEVDVTRAIDFLKSLSLEVEKTCGVRPSITSLLVKAVARALESHPILNSRFENECIVISKYINIGVAVAIENGLVVPVIREANKKSIIEIAKSMEEMAERARKESLTIEESTGGTFTVSNLGMFGIDTFAPIINPPESAILGVGRVVKKPVVLNDQIIARSMMTLTVVFDHRIMDGVIAAKFLQTLKYIIEKPEDLLKS